MQKILHRNRRSIEKITLKWAPHHPPPPPAAIPIHVLYNDNTYTAKDFCHASWPKDKPNELYLFHRICFYQILYNSPAKMKAAAEADPPHSPQFVLLSVPPLQFVVLLSVPPHRESVAVVGAMDEVACRSSWVDDTQCVVSGKLESCWHTMCRRLKAGLSQNGYGNWED